MFYQNLLRNVSHIPEAQKSRLKTKVRNACDKYSRLKTPYKYRNIIKNLQTNQNIVILKQDKGRGVVIMNRDKYIDKCIDILNTEQFKKLNKDSTSTLENKVQRLVRKIKSKIPAQLYSKIYPTGSQPAKFYGTAKVHKVPEGGSLDQLPLRQIVANTSSATYHLAKYLAKLLSPLCTSEYTIQSTADFIKKIKEEKVPEGFQLVSFDVKSLFTSVPLEDTIEIILHRIYDYNEICTEISRDKMKSLLILCTKNVIFSFNNNIYIQTDGIAMGSPLGPVLAGICMVELEREMIPTLIAQVKFWKIYVDDTIAVVKIGSVEYILSKLNSYHPNIQFTHEIEQDHQLAFLDVLVKHDSESIQTSVYRKITNTDVYIHWDAFAPISWKRSTLKTITKRAYLVCSTIRSLDLELRHIRNAFININGYPKWLVNNTFREVEREDTTYLPIIESPSVLQPEISSKTVQLVLPYAGKTGEHVMKQMKKDMNAILPNNINT